MSNERLRRLACRAQGLWLVLASLNGLAMDVAGAFFSAGPAASLFASAHHAALGFLEAHGLALILGLVFWLRPVDRMWNLAAGAVGLLLGGANLLFWPIFAAQDAVAMGYVATGLHGLLAGLNFYAASRR